MCFPPTKHETHVSYGPGKTVVGGVDASHARTLVRSRLTPLLRRLCSCPTPSMLSSAARVRTVAWRQESKNPGSNRGVSACPARSARRAYGQGARGAALPLQYLGRYSMCLCDKALLLHLADTSPCHAAWRPATAKMGTPLPFTAAKLACGVRARPACLRGSLIPALPHAPRLSLTHPPARAETPALRRKRAR